jgi:Lon protease-like protein
MTERCLADDATFGVVLIERGSEVGGNDLRFDVGTVARIVQAHRLDDGRWVLMTAGEHRLRVQRWLPDDPYPRAEVTPLPDRAAGGAAPDLPAVALPADPVRASFEACALAGLGPLDAQRLLELDDATTRLAELRSLLLEQVAALEFRLSR